MINFGKIFANKSVIHMIYNFLYFIGILYYAIFPLIQEFRSVTESDSDSDCSSDSEDSFQLNRFLPVKHAVHMKADADKEEKPLHQKAIVVGKVCRGTVGRDDILVKSLIVGGHQQDDDSDDGACSFKSM